MRKTNPLENGKKMKKHYFVEMKHKHEKWKNEKMKNGGKWKMGKMKNYKNTLLRWSINIFNHGEQCKIQSNIKRTLNEKEEEYWHKEMKEHAQFSLFSF